jgi:simple sugar transport system permease protein
VHLKTKPESVTTSGRNGAVPHQANPHTSSAATSPGSSSPLISRVTRIPQFGAAVALIGVFLFFAVTAGEKGFLTTSATSGWLNTAAELLIIAVPVGLLMIAGEFDLSIGSVVGASSIVIAVGMNVLELPFPVAFLLSVAIGVATGLFNGFLVNRTKLPSFIVTLAANFVLLGLALGVSRTISGTSTVSVALDGIWATLFASKIGEFNVSVFWAIGVCVAGYWVLNHTRAGNWIYATGGNLDGAIKAGVPTSNVKLGLFIATGVCSALCGALQAGIYSSGNAVQGQGFVFQAPIVAVIGGVLLVGGYGTVQGIVLGTLTYGVVSIGLFYTGWSSDWLSAFIGGLLIIAVIANDSIRKAALSGKGNSPRPRPETPKAT